MSTGRLSSEENSIRIKKKFLAASSHNNINKIQIIVKIKLLVVGLTLRQKS